MSMNTTIGFFVQQVLVQSPVLLVYVVGIVVCGIRARRAPAGATLAIIGLALMLLSTLAVMAVQAVVLQQSGVTAMRRGEVLTIVSVAGTLVRAAGVALLVVAVFAGRAEEVRGGFDPIVGRG